MTRNNDQLKSRVTQFDSAGNVQIQISRVEPSPIVVTSPPWEGDVTSNEAPWIQTGLTLDAWWDSLPESSKLSF